MKRFRFGLVCTLGLALSGCSLEATHELLSSSPLPSGIVHDPRMCGLGAVRVTTESYTDDTSVAIVRSLQHRGHFKVRGTISAYDSPEGSPHRWRVTYHDKTDVYEYVVPDYYHVRIVKIGDRSK